MDTLSYSTGVSPGFTRAVTNPGFPAKTEEGRGVYLDLSEDLGDNGVSPNGGGVDDVAGADFERIVGSPFSDYIKGSKAGQVIYGGGGADVLVAGGSGTTLNGGVDGDDCVGGASNFGCESTASNGPVVTRAADKVSVGSMTEGQGAYAELYLLGSSGGDGLTVDSTAGAPGDAVTLHLTGASSFEAPPAASGCALQDSATAVCTLSGRLASLLVAGLGGADDLRAEGLPATASLMMSAAEAMTNSPPAMKATTPLPMGRETTRCTGEVEMTPSSATPATMFSSAKPATISSSRTRSAKATRSMAATVATTAPGQSSAKASRPISLLDRRDDQEREQPPTARAARLTRLMASRISRAAVRPTPSTAMLDATSCSATKAPIPISPRLAKT